MFNWFNFEKICVIMGWPAQAFKVHVKKKSKPASSDCFGQVPTHG